MKKDHFRRYIRLTIVFHKKTYEKYIRHGVFGDLTSEDVNSFVNSILLMHEISNGPQSVIKVLEDTVWLKDNRSEFIITKIGFND